MRQKKYTFSLIVGLLVANLCAGQQLSQRLTNQDVIDMVALGLSDDVITDKIHAIDSTNFDTSVSGLRMLKAGKVSDPVIRAMIAPHSLMPVGKIVTPVNSGREKDQLPDEVGVYFMRNGQLTQMEPEIVGWKTGGVIKQAATLGLDKQHINGKIMNPRSSVQLSSPLEFFIKTPEGTSATEYQLLRLYEKDNRREFRALTGGVVHASGGAERTSIAFTPEKVSSRTWRIRLNGLERGEYGFLPPGVAASSIAASGKIYAFGVEGEDRMQTPEAETISAEAPNERFPSGQTSVIISALGMTAGTVQSGGVLIAGIERGGAIDKAGLHVGYIITSVDDKKLAGPAEFETELQNRAPGTKIRLGYMFPSSALGSRMYYPNQAILVIPPR
jgi:hypothetical protein